MDELAEGGTAVIEGLIKQLGEDVGVVLPEVQVTGEEPALPSVFMIGTAAAAGIGAATAAAAGYWHQRKNEPLGSGRQAAPPRGSGPAGSPASGMESGESLGAGPEVVADVRHAAVAFQSERHFRVDGTPLDPWAPLSGDYRASDGWVRLHCNFDHHRDAALRCLGLPTHAGKDDLVRACAGRTAIEIEEAVTRAGGCAAAMRTRAEWLAHPQGRAVAGLPLVRLSRLPEPANRVRPGHAKPLECERARHLGPDAGLRGRVGHAELLEPATPYEGASRATSSREGARTVAGDRPLSGVRVLDLTRVIAGPVAARTLAAHGAEVLRVGAAHLPEVPGLVAETGFGKRSCHIDLRSEPEVLRELVRRADVVIQAYRPGALREKGFGPEDLAELRPGIVSVEISAYGSRGPWADRRGFDSLVQMACGIAHENGDGSRPRPLPAQALDHASGFLAAFGAIAGLLRRTLEGGSWQVEVSLARTAMWLDGLGRLRGDGIPGPSTDGLLATMASRFGMLTYVTPPGLIKGARPHWASPPPRRGEHPASWV
ncbi:CoA transferase [Planotetraspora sp. A-T 1434]|uniref:CoA transferase n=1 Tax=Planotetraspora sp. A-T 1434 TaxID=2979219 RepID=UPI0021BDF6CA|nr:CoA transferase [Planotetraspora sp. A-T 1434]MCT9929216.1 CoA transferase [Planotetraspora sp. A-T 1434]